MDSNKKQCNKLQQDYAHTPSCIKAGQGDPGGGIGSQKNAKKSETPSALNI